MTEKDSRDKVAQIFGWGRFWRFRRSHSLSRKGPASLGWEKAGKIVLWLGLSLAIALLLSPQPQKPITKYKEGQIARDNIKAVGDFLVEDVETTKKRRKEMLAQVPPVFDLDEEAFTRSRERLHLALGFMRQYYQELTVPAVAAAGPGKPGPQPKPRFAAIYKELLKQKPEFDRLLGVSLPTPTFYLLAKAEFSPALEALVNQVSAQFFHQGVIGSRSLPGLDVKEILLRRLPLKVEQRLTPPYPFVELDEVRKPVASYCREVASDFSPTDRLLVCDLVQYLLVPNVSPNWAETQERQQAAVRNLQPTFFKVSKGELLLREGERITPLHLAKLKAQSRNYPHHRGLLIFLGTFASVLVLVGLSYQVTALTFKRFSTHVGDLVFLGVLLFTTTGITLGLLSLGRVLSPTMSELGQNLVYAAPIGMAAIFAAIFLGPEIGIVLAFVAATLAALLMEKSMPIFVYFIAAGLTGVWGVKHHRQRGTLILTGLFIGLVNLAMVTAFKLLEYPVLAKDLILGQVCALVGGLLTGILTLGFTPVIEAAFRYSSNIRLLELLNLDQPILRDLMLLAPGTYHHSLVVGQMVEAGAEAIGANPILAKAAAYYHDIGKIKKPAYFVENQLGGENKHEKLAPSMSSLILISHVKDGVDIARKHKLGNRIADIIQQHHGRCSINYFYNKAKQQASNPAQVNIDDYRYPGPKPQTKEAGLVLLADQIEAASKTLEEPTPARIQGLVQKIINNAFADGQLDECELTLKDLHLIAKSCNKILSGIFHQRVAYPHPAEKKKAHEDLDKQPAKKSNSKSKESQEKSREDLKRLGMG